MVGDPRRLDGTAGSASERVTRFARKLEEASGLALELIDESLTSVEASQTAWRRPVGPRRGEIDAVAAQILLQESLDRRVEDPAS